MAHRSDDVNNWTLIISRLLIGLAAIGAALVFRGLSTTIDNQQVDRECLFRLNTETDRVDSEIAVKQAQIFEAAILRPGADGMSTPEVQQLGRELHILISDRKVAYEERDAIERECD